MSARVLAVVHGIVVSHGGAITVESLPGAGSTFTMYLPRLDAQASAAPPAEALLPGGQERILFVDDEEGLARLGQERLRPNIPIIMCTGFSYVMNAEKAQALGIDAC